MSDSKLNYQPKFKGIVLEASLMELSPIKSRPSPFLSALDLSESAPLPFLRLPSLGTVGIDLQETGL